MVGLLWSHEQLGGAWSRLPRDIVYLIVRQAFAALAGLPADADVVQRPWGRGGVVRRGMVRRLARLRTLAAVSSAWRQAALPLLYGAVVCEQSARAASGWRTNLRLFAGCPAAARRARQLVVIARPGADDVTTLCAVLRQAGFARSRWPGLAAVQFLAQGEMDGPLGPEPGPGQAAVCAYVVGCLLGAKAAQEAAGLPPAGTSACRVDLRRALARMPAAPGTIAASFPRAPTMGASCELTALAIPFGAALGAAAATLTDLRLLAIPAQCVWDVLDPDAPFLRLRALSLEFERGAAPARRPARRNGGAGPEPFPRLRRLALANPPVDVRECVRAIAPGDGQFGRVMVETSAATARSVAAVDAAVLDVACYGPAPIAHDEAAAAAQRVLSTASADVRQLRLALATQLPVALDGVAMRATQLQTLELRVPVALAQVAPLLLQLPSLCKLKVPYIATAELPSAEVRSLDKLYLQMAAHPPLKPLSRSLQIVHVGFWDYRQSTRALCCHLLHFALRLPALQTIVHDSQAAVAMQSAVDALAVMHKRQARWTRAAPPPSGWLDHLRSLTITTHAIKS